MNDPLIQQLITRLDAIETRETAFEAKTQSQISQILSQLQTMDQNEKAFETRTLDQFNTVISRLNENDGALTKILDCLVGNMQQTGILPEHRQCRAESQQMRTQLDELEDKVNNLRVAELRATVDANHVACLEAIANLTASIKDHTATLQILVKEQQTSLTTKIELVAKDTQELKEEKTKFMGWMAGAAAVLGFFGSYIAEKFFK